MDDDCFLFVSLHLLLDRSFEKIVFLNIIHDFESSGHVCEAFTRLFGKLLRRLKRILQDEY